MHPLLLLLLLTLSSAPSLAAEDEQAPPPSFLPELNTRATYSLTPGSRLSLLVVMADHHPPLPVLLVPSSPSSCSTPSDDDDHDDHDHDDHDDDHHDHDDDHTEEDPEDDGEEEEYGDDAAWRVVHPMRGLEDVAELLAGQRVQLLPADNTSSSSSVALFAVQLPPATTNQSTSSCWRVEHAGGARVSLVDGLGQPIPALRTSQSDDHDHDHAAHAIDNALVGQAVGAVAVLLILPVLLAAAAVAHASSITAAVDVVLQSFGSGALLAVTSLVIYPGLVSALEHSEVPQWTGGVCVLAGVCSVMLAHFVHHHHQVVSSKEQQQQQSKLAVAVLVGDALANVARGLALSGAFLSCTSSSGWLVLGALLALDVVRVRDQLTSSSSSSLSFSSLRVWLPRLPYLVGLAVALAVELSDGADSPRRALLLAYCVGVYLFVALALVLPRLVVVRGGALVGLIPFGALAGCVAVGASSVLTEQCRL